jgi:hypothetical protein
MGEAWLGMENNLLSNYEMGHYRVMWLRAFIITLMLEVPVCWLLLQRSDQHIGRIIFVAFIANAISHPFLWFILPLYFQDYRVYLITGETLVITIETSVIWLGIPNIDIRFAFIVSVVMNFISWFLGRKILRLFDKP